jgi:predicted DNA-binding antitoxin AbrB/MazE fold protein
MSQEFHAIFESGVLRPLSPLNLPESAQVTIVVKDAMPTLTSADLQHQQQALDAMFAVVDALPQTPRNDDGLSGRDHDKILYGSPK